MTSLKITVRDDCAVYAWSCLLLSKSFCPWLLGGSQLLDRCQPSLPQAASTWYKANFSFHQPGCLSAFEQWADRPHPSITRSLYYTLVSWKETQFPLQSRQSWSVNWCKIWKHGKQLRSIWETQIGSLLTSLRVVLYIWWHFSWQLTYFVPTNIDIN